MGCLTSKSKTLKKYDMIDPNTIYIIKCKENKYFISNKNYLQHHSEPYITNNSTSWIKHYLPEKILEIIHDSKPLDVNHYVFKYMDKYGIDNVRGGSFTNIILTPEQKTTIFNNIYLSNDLYLNCGKSDICDDDSVIQQQIYSCYGCGKIFNTFEDVDNHEKYYHNKGGPISKKKKRKKIKK